MSQGMGGYQYSNGGGNTLYQGTQAPQAAAQEEYNQQIGNTVENPGNVQVGLLPINQNTEEESQYDQEDAFGVSNNIGTTYNPTGYYGPAINTAANQANNYNTMAGAAMQRQAAQINDPYAAQTQQQIAGVQRGQRGLISGLQRTAANGQNSQAYQQYQNSVLQGLQGQTAIANSAGAGPTGAGARRSAQEQNGASGASSLAGGQLVAQQAQQAAQSQLGTALGQQGQLANQWYGSNNQQAIANAQLQQGQMGQNYAGALGYNSLSQNEQGMQLNALQGASNAILGSQGLGMAEENVNNAQNAVYLGAATGAASSAANYGAQVAAAQQQAPTTGPTEQQLENPYYGS